MSADPLPSPARSPVSLTRGSPAQDSLLGSCCPLSVRGFQSSSWGSLSLSQCPPALSHTVATLNLRLCLEGARPAPAEMGPASLASSCRPQAARSSGCFWPCSPCAVPGGRGPVQSAALTLGTTWPGLGAGHWAGGPDIFSLPSRSSQSSTSHPLLD